MRWHTNHSPVREIRLQSTHSLKNCPLPHLAPHLTIPRTFSTSLQRRGDQEAWSAFQHKLPCLLPASQCYTHKTDPGGGVQEKCLDSARGVQVVVAPRVLRVALDAIHVVGERGAERGSESGPAPTSVCILALGGVHKYAQPHHRDLSGLPSLLSATTHGSSNPLDR